jgi:hypothetical protein
MSSIHYGSDSLTLEVTCRDKQGATVDIAGPQSIEWVAKVGGAQVLSKALGDGVDATNGANGVFTVTIDKTETETWSGEIEHFARVTTANGQRGTVYGDSFHLKPNAF